MKARLGGWLLLAAVLAACSDSDTSGGNTGGHWLGMGGASGQGGENGVGGEAGANTGGSGGGQPGDGDFLNGDFEQGPDVGWDQEPYPLIYLASEYGVQAFSGRYVAVLGPAPDDRQSATISQRVALPTCAAAMQFAIWLHSDESCDPPWWDDIGTYVNGEAVLRNDRLCRTDSTDGWRLATIDLSTWSGQTVDISFRLTTVYGDPLASTVGLDALKIICQ
jgi:hypothetical protein